ncbi:MAG: adenine phosphoribosyltransferase [Candidatus Omnitrophica bacterium]|nr:adenine phosphoribosyltransferase [Candidatus Omnitrophota bacterium]
MGTQSLSAIKKSIRAIPDFPKKGILFRDITPLLLDKDKFQYCIQQFAEKAGAGVDLVVSIESRGFIFGSALAYALGVGFVPIRKAGKLPHKTVSASYDLEYGQAVIEMHEDAVKKGSRVIIIDDVLATGGTALAAAALVRKFGGDIRGIYFLAEITALNGREKLSEHNVHALISY